jgi:unsaturated rhamnogalacturonyl hydrolase
MNVIQELLERIAACTISSKEESMKQMEAWQWGQGVALYALTKTYEQTGEERILDYVEQWLDDHLQEGLPGRSINTTAPVLAALRWMIIKNNPKYLELCTIFADWCVREAPRSLEGTYEHSCTENIYPNQIWADTLFMGCIYLVEWGVYTGDQAFIKEASRQFVLHYKYLGDSDSGLIYHGYYGNEGRRMGVFWGRGNGWFSAASAEVLPHFQGLPEYETTLHNYEQHSNGAIAWQHSSGAWHTVINDSNTYLETSVTAALAYGLNEGIRKGLLKDESYLENAKKAMEALVANVDEEGRVLLGSGATCVMTTAEEYNDISIHFTAFTQGLTMLALCSELAG